MWELPNRTVELVMKITGTVFLIIGGVGIILPLLPTTPFLLLALACYKTKILTIALLFLTIGYSVAFVVPFFIGKAFLIMIAICVSIHILSFPTSKPNAR